MRSVVHLRFAASLYTSSLWLPLRLQGSTSCGRQSCTRVSKLIKAQLCRSRGENRYCRCFPNDQQPNGLGSTTRYTTAVLPTQTRMGAVL
ncbi:hypothetical protein DFH94DRAFT_754916 [Russula ochroleuca]|uniref:Uncharacterized protein n=1 Tax=Russula ochroleuca TaxID=152965 RepID=A0A9P5MSP9_9AGAM|nr:hypothetical protein DFH94DRAFT_754916 [Russula ochroleuca]